MEELTIKEICKINKGKNELEVAFYFYRGHYPRTPEDWDILRQCVNTVVDKARAAIEDC